MVSAGVRTIGGIRYSPLRSQYLLNCGILLHLVYCRTSVKRTGIIRADPEGWGSSRQLFFPYTPKEMITLNVYTVGMGCVVQHCE